MNIDATAGGIIMSKTPEDALDLFEEMANTQSLWSNERAIQKKGGSMEVDNLIMINAKLDALSKRMNQMMQGLSMENVNYVNNFKGQQNQMYGNTYNPS